MVGSRPLRAGCPQRPGDSLDPITAWPRPVDNRAGGAQRSCANDCDGSWDGMMTEQANGRTLGWLGTGRMGAELVRRLLAAGCDVAVYNRTKAKAEPLAAAGAKIVDSAAELANRDIVFVTVGTSRDLINALAGPLTFAVSGPRPAFDAAQPYLDLLGAGATYVGEGELARIVKLCHNLFLGVVTQSLAEVTVLAEKSGVSRQAFLACLNDSVMGSTFTRYKSPALVNLDFHATFTAELLRKDFDLGLAAARDREVPLRVASLVHQLVQSLVGHGLGQSDFAALLVLQARSAGLELVSEDANVSDGLEPASLTGGEETP